MSVDGIEPKLAMQIPTAWLFGNKQGYVRVGDRELDLRSRHNHIWLIDEDETVIGTAETRGIRSKIEMGGEEYELSRKKPDDQLAVLKHEGRRLGAVRMKTGRARGLEVDVPEITDAAEQLFIAAATVVSWQDLLSILTYDVGRRQQLQSGGGGEWFGGDGGSADGGGGGGGD